MKPKMILAGGTGFLGQILAKYFQGRGFEVQLLTRSGDRADLAGRAVPWDARTLGPWKTELEGASVLFNLTGKSVNCRYHARNRQEILRSRVDSTRVLGQAVAGCSAPPVIWLNASTATIYKHTMAAAWDESGEIGSTPEAKDAFSIDVAKVWEEVFERAQTPSTRKVALRMAMVLGLGKNSVFPVLRRLTRLGLGGKMGTGRQFVSWIHQADFCRAIEWIINHEELRGPVNVAAPNPIQNQEMMSTLRSLCGVRVGLPAAKWMLELGAFFLRTETELIIKSRKVFPGKLQAGGFQFQFPKIGRALEDLHRKRV